MSEEQNIQQSKPGDGNKHFPEDSQAPQKENMEVHHHGHVHHQKKWKEYLFQFLMLFLAVFCGSLAEYQLEHVIEHKRAKEFAVSMINDLEADTAQLKEYKRYMTYAVNNVDTLLALLYNNEPKDIPSGKLYWYGLFGGAPRTFIPNDATIQQMMGSGSLRYFTNKSLNRHVAHYDQLCRVLRTREVDDISVFTEVRKKRAQIFEFRYNEAANNAFQAYFRNGDHSLIDSFINTRPPLLTYDKAIFNQYIELVRSRFLFSKVRSADTLLNDATALIGELKKEYHPD